MRAILLSVCYIYACVRAPARVKTINLIIVIKSANCALMRMGNCGFEGELHAKEDPHRVTAACDERDINIYRRGLGYVS
jgi:hypothetical protein